MEKFADILKDLIEDKNVSLRTLATESKVSATQYGKYLKGIYPTLEVAIRIANYFECSLDYLFGISDKKTKREYKDFNLSTFIERYQNLLKTNNTTHYKFAKTHNLSESCLRHWKYGQIPKTETLVLIATNLFTSIDYLVGRI